MLGLYLRPENTINQKYVEVKKGAVFNGAKGFSFDAFIEV